MNKEEKAREYRAKMYQERIIKSKSYFDSIDIELAYRDGYTRAEQDLSTQLTACKEALREILINYTRDLRSYIHESHNLIAFDEREDCEFVDTFLSKAKTLIDEV